MTRNGIIVTLIIIAALIGVAYVVATNNNETTPPDTTTTPPVVTPPVTQAGSPDVSTDSRTAVSNSTAVVTGSIKPNGAQTNFWFEYGTTEAMGTKTQVQNIGSGFNTIPATGYITGLRPSTKYFYRLSAQNSFGAANGDTETFTTHATNPPPPANAPTASTVAATQVTDESAELQGNVNPRGTATSYWFEYGTSNSLGFATNLRSAGSGTSAQIVTFNLDDLDEGTRYFYRINAQNDFGTVNGSIMSFTTTGTVTASRPEVEAKAATAVAARSATLNGEVTPNGADTSYWFEYSTDSLVGSVLGTATPERNIDGDADAAEVSASITGLSPNTTYNFRVAARNSQGTVRSAVMSFTTNGN